MMYVMDITERVWVISSRR